MNKWIIPRFIPENSTKIELPGGVVYIYKNKQNKPTAISYRGKSNKREWYYNFKTEKEMWGRIDLFFKSIDMRKSEINRRRMERNNFEHTLKPGDILETCWGYEQTNVEFYEIIEVKGKYVIIRQLEAQTEETGFMSGITKPIIGKYCGESLKRKVSLGNVVKIKSFITAFKWDGKPAPCSWYA